MFFNSVLLLLEIYISVCAWLTVQTFHEDLYSRRETVDRTLARCRRMLQESPSEEQSSVDVDIRLTEIREQFDALCLRSDRRFVLTYIVTFSYCNYEVKMQLQKR